MATDPTTAAGRLFLQILDIQARHVSLPPELTQDFPFRILAIEAEAAAALLDELTEEALAKALTRIRGAHNNADFETEEGEPCEWCQLAGKQAAEAVATIERL